MAVSLAFMSPAIAGDDICHRLDTFDRAAFADPAVPHSIIFIWKPPGILGTVECMHYGEPNAKALCGWLLENTSREFDEALPERILGCYGFRFPLVPNVARWTADYPFFDMRPKRWVLLNVVQDDPEMKTDAVRWTVFPDGKSDNDLPLPPVKDEPETKEPVPL